MCSASHPCGQVRSRQCKECGSQDASLEERGQGMKPGGITHGTSRTVVELVTFSVINFPQISILSHFSETRKKKTQKKVCHVVTATPLQVPSQQS